MNRASKSLVSTPPRSGRAIDSHQLLLAFFLVGLLIAVVAAIMLAASTGHVTAALVIALVAGGSFSTILC